MTNPSTWPTDPPTEPGWYWWSGEDAVRNRRTAPLRVDYIKGLNGLWTTSDWWAFPKRVSGTFGRWRPGRIEP